MTTLIAYCDHCRKPIEWDKATEQWRHVTGTRLRPVTCTSRTLTFARPAPGTVQQNTTKGNQ